VIARLRTRLGRVVSPTESDRGISLVELLVSMVVFALLLSMTVGFFVSASRANLVDQQVDSTNRTASNGVDEMTRVIRGALTNPVLNQTVNDPEFVSAGTNSMIVYSSINLTSNTAQTLKIQFAIVGSSLIETTWLPIVANGYSTFATTASSTRTLASPVVLPAAGGPNLFSYIDGTGATIAPVSGFIPTASVVNIAAVTVNLQIGTANTGSQSTLLTNTVGLPNVLVTRNPS
jgi:prepilin-type N-terminal cleavage/methylation domain-containing protein